VAAAARAVKARTIRRRPLPPAAQEWPAGLPPLLARLFAARGLAPGDLARVRLADLAPPAVLGGLDAACHLLDDAIVHGRRLCVVGDFDADGATGTAVAVRGLRLLGATDVCYRVPNRLRDGYGLSVGLVEGLASLAPDVIVTVDNGIASHAGVAAARARGIAVVVTDHHLPGATLPDADAIVNPNAVAATACGHARPPCVDCADAAQSCRSLAGVGVVFYLLLALRACRRERGAFAQGAAPDLAPLLDLVALGTVADLVPLDGNNRILVAAGLRRIRGGRACAGIDALFRAAGRDASRAVAGDLGYAIGPRINAAGRLDDMGLGIECLLAEDPVQAAALASRLSAINAERRDLQAAMVEQAEAMVAAFVARFDGAELPHGIVLHEPGWHPGVIGLVASRLKERLGRPVVAFATVAGVEEATGGSGATAPAAAAELRGSARSVAGFHLRDALAAIDAGCPGLIGRFGGHAMAAGLSLAAPALARFAAEFDAIARARLDPAALDACIWSDGELGADEFTHEVAHALRYAAPWGQGFVEPAFDNVFEVAGWRCVGERHLRLQLRAAGGAEPLEAIMFDALEAMPPPPRLRAVFQLDLDEWNGRERVRLLVRHLEPA
jgi:single-stranded-DNA-specific exonuclease